MAIANFVEALVRRGCKAQLAQHVPGRFGTLAFAVMIVVSIHPGEGKGYAGNGQLLVINTRICVKPVEIKADAAVVKAVTVRC